MSERDRVEIIAALQEAIRSVESASDKKRSRTERISDANTARRLVELVTVKIKDVISDVEAERERAG